MGVFDIIDQRFRQTKYIPTVCVRCGTGSGLNSCNLAPEGGKDDIVLLCGPCTEFHHETMTPLWFWYIGEEEPCCEDFNFCATREEAIAAARDAANAGQDQVTLVHSKPYQYDDDIFADRAEDILDWWAELNDSISMDIETTCEQDADLQHMLAATFTAWRLKHRIGRCEGPADWKTEIVLLDADDA